MTSKIFNNRVDVKFYLKKFLTPDEDGLSVERYMWYGEPDMPCHAFKLQDKNRADEKLPYKIYIFEDGSNDIEKFEAEIKNTCAEGKCAFVVDMAGMGKCEPYKMNPLKSAKDDLGTEEKLSRDLFFLGDSLCALRVYHLIRTIDLLKEELGVCDFSLFFDGKTSVLGRILEILYEDIKAEYHNEISVEDIIKNKYYDKFNIAGMVMPELGIYLKK